MAEDANGTKRPLEVCRVFKIDCSGTNRTGIGQQTIKINFFSVHFSPGLSDLFFKTGNINAKPSLE